MVIHIARTGSFVLGRIAMDDSRSKISRSSRNNVMHNYAAAAGLRISAKDLKTEI